MKRRRSILCAAGLAGALALAMPGSSFAHNHGSMYCGHGSDGYMDITTYDPGNSYWAYNGSVFMHRHRQQHFTKGNLGQRVWDDSKDLWCSS